MKFTGLFFLFEGRTLASSEGGKNWLRLDFEVRIAGFEVGITTAKRLICLGLGLSFGC